MNLQGGVEEERVPLAALLFFGTIERILAFVNLSSGGAFVANPLESDESVPGIRLYRGGHSR
jgi:hypothetical protein